MADLPAEPYRLHDAGPTHELRHDTPGKVCIVMTFAHAGQYVRGHDHAFDHVMRVAAGVLRVTAGDEARIMRAGEEMLIPEGVRHGLMALASNTVAVCEHEIRGENGELRPDAFAPDGVPIEWVDRLTRPRSAAA